MNENQCIDDRNLNCIDNKCQCSDKSCKSRINDQHFFIFSGKTVPRIRLTKWGGQLSTPELLNADKFYYCENKNCNRAFKNRRHRNYHMKHFCGKPPRFKCGYCPHTSCRLSSMKIHLKTLHKKMEIKYENLSKPCSCHSEDCSISNSSKTQKSQQNLNRGSRNKSATPGFKCFYCDFKGTKTSARYHCRSQHPTEKNFIVELLIDK